MSDSQSEWERLEFANQAYDQGYWEGYRAGAAFVVGAVEDADLFRATGDTGVKAASHELS